MRCVLAVMSLLQLLVIVDHAPVSPMTISRLASDSPSTQRCCWLQQDLFSGAGSLRQDRPWVQALLQSLSAFEALPWLSAADILQCRAMVEASLGSPPASGRGDAGDEVPAPRQARHVAQTCPQLDIMCRCCTDGVLMMIIAAKSSLRKLGCCMAEHMRHERW